MIKSSEKEHQKHDHFDITKMQSAFDKRDCPVCFEKESTKVVLKQNINFESLGAFAFASRKVPEFMHHRMVECSRCGLLYSSPALKAELLNKLYSEASFDSGLESKFAASTYRRLLLRYLNKVNKEKPTLDVGAGDGTFIAELIDLGFKLASGVEPSLAPVKNTTSELQGRIKVASFSKKDFLDNQFSLISCFQTIEHLRDPGLFIADAYQLLAPNGLIMIVAHNRRGFLNRILGRKSPIIDIEHLQLFCPKSLKTLLVSKGFSSVDVHSFCNTYPIRYWLRLFPAPKIFKKWVEAGLDIVGISKIPLSFPVGNLVAFGFKNI